MGYITADRNQLNMLGYCLDDFVPKDAKCRFVAKIVSELDLSKLYDDYSTQGNDAFEPSIMLATWFYAYSEAVTSSRKVETRCKRDLHFIYISGNLQPDHTSLNRFRKRHLELLCDYFLQILHLAREKGVSDFKIVSFDGTKIQAASSSKKSKDAKGLEKYLAAVRENIKQYLELCEQNDNESDDNLQDVQRRLKDLQNLEQKLLKRQEQLEERKKELKPEDRANHKINLTEPDAIMMDKVSGKQKLPAYNAQVAVDTKSQLIVSPDVVQDRSDQKQFRTQHQKVESNLAPDPERQYLTDSGYHSLEQLEYIEENQIDAFVSDPSPQHRARKPSSEPLPPPEQILQQKPKFQRSDFTYFAEDDYFQCPAGDKLLFKGTCRNKGWQWRIYEATLCHQCAFRSQCLPKPDTSRLRTLLREDREYLAEQMRDKVSTDAAKEKLKLRSTTVEPVIGNLKANLGFWRFRLKGLDNVRAEFNLMCIAHNLNKLYSLFSYLYLLSRKLRTAVLKIFKELLAQLSPTMHAWEGN